MNGLKTGRNSTLAHADIGKTYERLLRCACNLCLFSYASVKEKPRCTFGHTFIASSLNEHWHLNRSIFTFCIQKQALLILEGPYFHFKYALIGFSLIRMLFFYNKLAVSEMEINLFKNIVLWKKKLYKT